MSLWILLLWIVQLKVIHLFVTLSCLFILSYSIFTLLTLNLLSTRLYSVLCIPIAPGDYVRFVTTIEFTAGTTQLELPVPTFEDEVNELGEIFFANLSNPRGGGAMLGRDVDATIEIIDDDREFMLS